VEQKASDKRVSEKPHKVKLSWILAIVNYVSFDKKEKNYNRGYDLPPGRQ
jgi:hypothetical protein